MGCQDKCLSSAQGLEDVPTEVVEYVGQWGYARAIQVVGGGGGTGEEGIRRGGGGGEEARRES